MSSKAFNDFISLNLEVQKKILGQRESNITPLEINRMIQQPITSEFNLILYQGLRRKALDPDVTLIQLISKARTIDYLIPIALCLRFDADSNMYVDLPKIGTVHIMGYVYMMIGGYKFGNNPNRADENVLNSIVLMLMIEGSRPSLPMFDPQAGKIIDESRSKPIRSLSVLEWLYSEGYPTILDKIITGNPTEIQRYYDSDSMTQLSILLDNQDLINRPYLEKDLNLAIRSYSSMSVNNILNNVNPLTQRSPYLIMDIKGLDESVIYLNADSFEKIINKGYSPSYLLINKILIGMSQSKEPQHILKFQELERMLIISISTGTSLDLDQRIMISTLGSDILQTVVKEYEQPYWRKICKVSTTNNTASLLKQQALALNIDPTMSKKAICDKITDLSKLDKESVKEEARRRQSSKSQLDTGSVNEFIDKKGSMCINKGSFSKDPFDYNDINLAYYRDEQGSLWCFGSEQFNNLLTTGLNPYNMTILPLSFKEQLKYKINILQDLGIDTQYTGISPSKIPQTFSEAIDNLSTNDQINEQSSQNAVNDFINLAVENGVSGSTIKSLSKEQMMNALRSINYPIELEPLTQSHSLVTTSRAINYLNNISPQLVKDFFQSIHGSKILQMTTTSRYVSNPSSILSKTGRI